MKMQRFDRFIYPKESDRVLKKPIEDELRRLEKIKNEQKEMRSRYYDNELTITALYNHIKLIAELTRDLEEREVLRKEKNEAVRKLHEQTREHSQQVRDLKDQLRVGNKTSTPAKQSTEVPQLKKEENAALNVLGATLKGRKYP
jgi:predicted transcriptional regulator